MNVTKSSWSKYFLQTHEGKSKILCVRWGTIARPKQAYGDSSWQCNMGIDGSWLHRNNGWIVTPVKLLWSLLGSHCLWHGPRPQTGTTEGKICTDCLTRAQKVKVHPSSYLIQGGRGLDDTPAEDEDESVDCGRKPDLQDLSDLWGSRVNHCSTHCSTTERAHVSQHYDKCWWIIGLAVMCTASVKVMRAVFENGH